ncbi:hypothetical protein [Cytobacillus solani]|uniref:Uncharacterized protein n=1 Tax=Cytobacillus solani TaxID=1637975 RepID=A0A0Q3QM42_9BACI|nr:hypothetical protein [Cytobacillus solani]KQL18806.1 hypothetical protein AN957_09630 [Cytobacillus solani]
MNVRVPLEVIEEGLTDEYVQIETSAQKAHSEKYDAESKYNRIIGDIHVAITTQDNRRRECVDTYYLGDSVWTRTLVIEELVRELTEAAGNVVEARKTYEIASAEREKFSIRMGWS